ncbi:MAG: pre-peptidase C-terminal domain-containing protein [Cyanobacteria bacterium J06642_2]
MNVFSQQLRASRAIVQVSRSFLVAVVAGACISLAPSALAQDILRAPHSEAGTIGRLTVGQSAVGELKGSGDDPNSTYHTYTVTVPPNTALLTVEMSALADLDLGIKHGSAIEEYGTNADWDLGDDSESNSAKLEVKNPAVGTWFIDVINSLYSTDEVPYRLEVRTE